MGQNILKSKKKSTLRRWFPNQHGAWAMVIGPCLLGSIRGGFSASAVILLLSWTLGYCAYFFLSKWLVSKGKRQYGLPLLVYSTLAALIAVPIVFMHPRLLWWIPYFLPLLGISMWECYQRRERSLVNNFATILAAVLMGGVAFSISNNTKARYSDLDMKLELQIGWSALWVAMLFVGIYYLLSVFYVKTFIRKRGKMSWLLASVIMHWGCISLVWCVYLLFPKIGIVWAILWTAVWVFIALRATAVGVVSYVRVIRREPPLSVKKIGMMEIPVTLLVFFAGLF